MLTAEEYLKYGAFMCIKYYKEYGSDCEKHCPFGINNEKGKEKFGHYLNSFCVFPSLEGLTNDYFNFDFAIKAVENFKNKVCSKTTLREIFLNKFPHSLIDDICKEHCPKIYFDIDCEAECKMGLEINKCWNKEILVESDEFKKFIENLEKIK